MASQPQPSASRASVNQNLRDRGIAHAVYLEKLKDNEAATVIGYYDSHVIPDLEDKLAARLALIEARGIDVGPETTKRLELMIEALNASVDAWTGTLVDQLVTSGNDIGQHEAEWNAGAINDALPKAVAVHFEAIVPSVQTVRAAIVASPIDGVLLKDVVARLGRGTSERMEAEIRKGIVTGETTPQITARVRSVTGLARNSAEAVTRTAVGHASAVARQSTYAANSSLIKGVQLVETLDTRTCIRCQALDGKVFPVDSGPRAPHHINCRGTSVPVLKSWSELGISAKEITGETRASMNGQVSAKVTYAEWIKTQSAEVQDDALGPTRAALLRAGKLEVGDFVNRGGDQLTLADLKKKDPAAFKR